MKEKVVVKLPIRINFGGAWSDTPPFCINEGGCVCNTSATINNRRPIVVKIEKINQIYYIKMEGKMDITLFGG